MTTLAQRWHNVGTTSAQRRHNVGTTLAQRWHNVGTTLAQRWRNVELATVSLRWPNGQNYVAPTSPNDVVPTVLVTLGQRWANVVVLSGLHRLFVRMCHTFHSPMYQSLVDGTSNVLTDCQASLWSV